jgi:alkylhydroperoxidase/carboxymuconolactone decarboxylase family protein YurZ
MDSDVVATRLENLDQRLARVEQFLPTLATKDELREAIAPLATKEELRLAIAEAVAPLATKEELRLAIAEAVAPLATKEELRLAIAEAVAPLATKAELREEGERSRRHMDIIGEALRGDVQLLAEHLSVVMSRLTDS